jgi:hypothetical protein
LASLPIADEGGGGEEESDVGAKMAGLSVEDPPGGRGGGSGGAVRSRGRGDRPTDRDGGDLERGGDGRGDGSAVPLRRPGGARGPVRPHAPGVRRDKPDTKGTQEQGRAGGDALWAGRLERPRAGGYGGEDAVGVSEMNGWRIDMEDRVPGARRVGGIRRVRGLRRPRLRRSHLGLCGQEPAGQIDVPARVGVGVPRPRPRPPRVLDRVGLP